MKQTMKKILVDALKRYLPIILNALCASICVTTVGCKVVAEKLDVEICPIEKGVEI